MAELIPDDPPVEGGEWPMWLPGERRLWMSERLVPHALLPGYGIDRAKHYRVVAVEGGVDDWAAYLHYEDRSVEDVCQQGSKLSLDDAHRVFPLFDIQRYRL